jgi:hypothetical protein
MWDLDQRRVNGMKCIWYLPMEVGLQMTSEAAMQCATNLGWEY